MQHLIRWSNPREAELVLAQYFSENGWSVSQGLGHVDMVIRNGSLAYAAELKSAPEGRRDRLIPLLAQAILQVQAQIPRVGLPAKPLAVVAAPRVSDSVVHELQRFAQEYAPEVAIGVFDQEGFRWFSAEALQPLNARRAPKQRALVADHGIASHLFSDLNQWMLKVLLAPYLPPDLLSAPRGEFRSASQLALAANVSAMSASRFIRQLKAEGFLDEQADELRIVRIGALLRRWRAALLRPSQEWPMRWIIRGNPERQLEKLMQSSPPEAPPAMGHWAEGSRWPRMCLGYFAAAEYLGFGFVHGIQPHVYVERLDPPLLQQLGLVSVQPGVAPDVVIKIPLAPQALFRAAVWRSGLPVSDILQVWLDVVNQPARGEAQAAEIERRLLAPMLEEK